MRTFDYRAWNASGRAVGGHALAADVLELDRDLEEAGLVLLRAVEVRGARGADRVRLSRPDLVTLASQLATLTAAGVPMVEGLKGIAARSADPELRALVEQLVIRIESGESLSQAMDAYPRCFPEFFRASVRAGEAAGALDETLTRATAHLEWVQAMRATTLQALLYPAVLAAAVAGLIGILLVHVLPKLMPLFPGGLEDLPRETRAVVAVSDFLTTNGGWLGALGAALAGGLVLAQRSPGPRRATHRVLLAVPRLGGVARKIATSKFASTAATLHAAGCDVVATLSIAGGTCGNAALEHAFRTASARVRDGLPISEALEREPLVDPLLVQMIGVGETSGRLGETLERVSRHYDEDVPRAVRRMLVLFEPALLVGAGLVVAFVLLAVLLPILEMYDRLG